MDNIYTPLNSARKEIRILHILPASSLTDDIVVRLEKLVLDEPGPEFGALSYTWGERTEERTITVEGKQNFPVTDNIYYALRRLRWRRNARAIWIDAICINQNDLNERSQQVNLMADIYSRAVCVWIWFGESEDRLKLHGDALGSFRVLQIWISMENPYNLSGTPSARQVRYLTEALRNTRPYWWDRAWVVQEFACARRVFFLFGPCQTGWHGLRRILRCAWRYGNYENPDFRDIIGRGREVLQKLRIIQNRYQCGKVSAYTLMWQTAHTDAKEPHDKVFSLLNLLPEGTRAYFTPSYAEPLEETYARSTFAVLASEGRLDAFGLVTLNCNQNMDGCALNHSHHRNPKIPSWAIDLTDLQYSPFHTTVDFGSFDFPWAQARTTVTNIRYLGSGMLELTGQVLDYIHRWTYLPPKSLSERSGREDLEGVIDIMDEASARAMNTNIWTIFSSAKKIDPAGKDPQCFRDSMFDPKLAKTFKYDYLAHGFVLWELAAGFSKPTQGTQARYGRHSGVRRDRWHGDIEQYSVRMAGASVIFATKRGFVGVAPYGVREGDAVAILDGARLPITLSPFNVDGHCAFRGFAYVHGTMTRAHDQLHLRAPIPGTLEQRTFILH